MGFFDAIGAVLQSDMGHDAFNKIFKSSSDSKLIEWWDNRENCSNIDLEIINLAEKEMNNLMEIEEKVEIKTISLKDISDIQLSSAHIPSTSP